MNKNSIFSRQPGISKIWDYEKNIVNPEEEAYSSNDKYWLKCSKGHSYPRRLSNWHLECPECKIIRKSIAFKKYIMDFLDPEENKHIDIYHTFSYERIMVHWRCKKCGYSWDSFLRSRTTDKCPCCELGVVIKKGINDCATVIPLLKEELDEELNKLDILEHIGIADKKQKINWKCRKCGYKWPSTVFARTRGKTKTKQLNDCPVCGHAKRSVTFDIQYPILEKMFDKEMNHMNLSDVNGTDYGNSFYWQCPKHGSFFQVLSVMIRAVNENTSSLGCPYCKGNKMLVQDSLPYQHPDLMEEWSYEDNCIIVDPYDVSETSYTVVWWKCSICKGKHARPVYNRVLIKKQCKTPCSLESGYDEGKMYIL